MRRRDLWIAKYGPKHGKNVAAEYYARQQSNSGPHPTPAGGVQEAARDRVGQDSVDKDTGSR